MSMQGAFPRKPLLSLLSLTLVAASAVFARTAMGPLQETMRTAFPLSDKEIALVQGPALAIPLILASMPLGLMIDHFRRVRLLAIFTVVSIAGSLASAGAGNFLTLFLARALLGFTAPAVGLIALSLIADLYPPASRGRANMLLAIGQVFAMSAAFGLGGSLVVHFGPDPMAWRYAMAALTAPLVPVLAVSVMLREPARISAAESGGAEPGNISLRQSTHALWQLRHDIAPLLGGLLLVEIGVGAILVWAAPTFARKFSMPPDAVGAYMGLVLLVSGLLGPLLGGAVADFCQRYGGPRRTFLALALLSALTIPAGLFPLAASPIVMAIGVTAFKSLNNATILVANTLGTIIVRPEVRGLYLSFSAALNLLFAFGVAPVLVSLMTDGLGGPDALPVALVGLCTALGAGAFIVFARTFWSAVRVTGWL